MKCIGCDGQNTKYHCNGERSVKTLRGIKIVYTETWQCFDCRKFFKLKNDLYPKGSHYGWDVITALQILLEQGMNYSQIGKQIGLSKSTISDLKRRYIDAVSE